MYLSYWCGRLRFSLGDRHGENLSFEEGTGGILHVDFNCLFDKVGRWSLWYFLQRNAHQISRAKRLRNQKWFHSGWLTTWSMPLVLMGTTVRYPMSWLQYDPVTNVTLPYIGPFRRTCEITLSLLRQNEDSLMTILETFLHDPTTDFIGKRVSLSSPSVRRPVTNPTS